MRTADPRQLWRMLAAATLATALFSLALDDSTDAGWVVVQCANSTAPQCGGACSPGEACNPVSRGNVTECVCQVLGCCQLNGSCSEGVTGLACFGQGGDFVANGTCGVDCLPQTPTATPTATATATPTRTPAPDGATCDDPADCVSGNCVDDVCCDTACAGADQSCDQPGREGTCTGVAPAPAASQAGLLALVLALATVAAATLWRSRSR